MSYVIYYVLHNVTASASGYIIQGMATYTNELASYVGMPACTCNNAMMRYLWPANLNICCVNYVTLRAS